jgi:hypothetical protein
VLGQQVGLDRVDGVRLDEKTEIRELRQPLPHRPGCEADKTGNAGQGILVAAVHGPERRDDRKDLTQLARISCVVGQRPKDAGNIILKDRVAAELSD